MKLIDRNKLLEGLKKIKQNLSASPIVVIEDVESLVESLEEKEVDLEAEFVLYLKHKFNIPQEGNKLKTNGWNPSPYDLLDIAKHFFELGLKAKGE